VTRAKISEYSATANDNTDVNGINIAEGCPPSSMNNMGREIMAALKRFQVGSDGDGVTVGGSLVVSGSTSVNTFNVDVISEKTSAAGVTVDGVLLKDSGVNGLTVGLGAGSVSTNTAVGASALAANTTGANNVAVGYQALDANTTGKENTAVGANALSALTTGSTNVAVGYNALLVATTANDCTAVGHACLDANTTGASNTAVGQDSLGANTTGSSNAAFGRGALAANTTANNNTAIGRGALTANTTGANNTAVGYIALEACTTGEQNTSVGSFAGRNITTANEVTAIGYAAMSASGTAATGSTAIGRAALNNVTGTLNTAIGNGSGNAITSGSKNTIIGSYNGNQGGLDIRTASNNIVLSDGDGNPRLRLDAAGILYCPEVYNSTSGAAANVHVNASFQIVRSVSSIKYKRDIQNANYGLAEVMQLRPVTYKGKNENDGDTVFGGLIAEEVHAAGLTEFVQYAADGTPDALAYGNMVSLAFKAIQELSAQVTALQAEVNTLKGQ
jgi:trimeric autotransporter adhesin